MFFFFHLYFGPVPSEVVSISPHRYHHLVRVLQYVHEIPRSSPFTASFHYIHHPSCALVLLLCSSVQTITALPVFVLQTAQIEVSDVHSFPVLCSLITSSKILKNFSSATSRWASYLSVRATSPNHTSKRCFTKL